MIKQEDIAYSDNKITVLYPESKCGVLLSSRIPKFGSYIRFNIPFYVGPSDYRNKKSEIINSFGYLWMIEKKRIYLRVDPERTYISETNETLASYMNRRKHIPYFNQFFSNFSNKYHVDCHLVPVQKYHFILKNN
jgi:hypothetical protein